MASLLDLAPQGARVLVAGTELRVYGISATGLAVLMSRFPLLRQLLTGAVIDVEKILALGGDVVAAIIAAGCGHPGNADAEKIAAVLPIGDQAEILGAIVKETMPGGVDPLAEKLKGLMSALGLRDSSSATANEPIETPPQRLLANGHAPADSMQTSPLQ